MRILFVHLLNNYTGSPRVLSNFLQDFTNDDHDELHLLTSRTEGCLSNIEGLHYYWNKYHWSSNKILLFIILLFSQIYQFMFVLFQKKYDCVYLNTILPFGAAIAAKIKKERIIYHIHEFYPYPNLLQRFCKFIAKKSANDVLFVSKYLENCYSKDFKCKKHIVYNTVSTEFQNNAKQYLKDKNYIRKKFESKIILLPSALKKYKGVSLFLELARKIPQYTFMLVTSNSFEETETYFKGQFLPENFLIKNQIRNMGEIYSTASIVLNLSLPHGENCCIESFCMGLIEAFEYKTPCVAPCYGGPVEIIDDKKNGYLLEIDDLEKVEEVIRLILSDFRIYHSLSEAAYLSTKKFQSKQFMSDIKKIIYNI